MTFKFSHELFQHTPDQIQEYVEAARPHDFENCAQFDLAAMPAPTLSFEQMIDALYRECQLDGLIKVKGEYKCSKKADQIRTDLTCLMWNLYKVWGCDDDGYLRLSLNTAHYRKGSKFSKGQVYRYNPYGISKNVCIIVKLLHQFKFIELQRGFCDRTTGIGKQTRVRATKRLLGYFRGLPNWIDEQYNDARAITLRCIKSKAPVDFLENDFSHDIRTLLTKYSEAMAKANVTIPGATGDVFEFPCHNGQRRKVSLRNTSTFAVFHLTPEGDWKMGRMYGPWWLNIPSAEREKIIIDGEETVTLDYSAQVLNILSSWCNVQIEGDAYAIEPIWEDLDDKSHRAITKAAVLRMVNCKNKNSAIGSMRTLFSGFEEPRKKVVGQFIQQYFDAISSKYPHLEPYFFKEQWPDVYRQDSDLARDIIREFVGLGLPVLAIHDGFMVKKQHEQLLRDVMGKCWSSRFGTTITIKKE